MSDRLRWPAFFLLLALGNLVNAVWMLSSPHHWYQNLPGRVPDFGPMNEHFVRDIGCVSAMVGVLALRAAFDEGWRAKALFVLQLWFVPHALVHLFDTLRGLVSMEHLTMDVPLVYAPPLVIGVMQLLLRRETSRSAPWAGAA